MRKAAHRLKSMLRASRDESRSVGGAALRVAQTSVCVVGGDNFKVG